MFTDQKRAFFVQKVQFFSRVGLGACDIARIATKLPVIIQPGIRDSADDGDDDDNDCGGKHRTGCGANLGVTKNISLISTP